MMLSRFRRLQSSSRSISTSNYNYVKVAVCGSSGGIGQPLALLLKLSRLVSELSLYDIVPLNLGVATDLSHIDTPCIIKSYVGLENLKTALKGAQIVLITAGMPRKPGMERDDLFKINASIASEIMQATAEASPNALIGIITNPINSIVPMASEILKKAGVYDHKRLFGITTLDILRARTFVARAKGIDINNVNIPVIGGHSGITIIPLVSQCKPCVSFPEDELSTLIHNIQEAGTEVVKAKVNGSATLSMAYAAALFTFSLCRGITGEDNVVECSFVQTDNLEVDFFAGPILLGPGGMKKNLGIGKISDFENQLLKKAIPELKNNIKQGIDYAKNHS